MVAPGVRLSVPLVVEGQLRSRVIAFYCGCDLRSRVVRRGLVHGGRATSSWEQMMDPGARLLSDEELVAKGRPDTKATALARARLWS